MPRDLSIIRFNALRNALYHTARRRSFERWNRVFNFAVVALGGAAVANVFPTGSGLYLSGAVAVVGALQLVFDLGGSARTHQALQRDYFALIAEIEEAPECTDDLCRHWEGKLIRITADEPPVLRALDAKAYNDAIDALEWGEGERLVLKWYHYFFATIYPFDGTNFRKVSEASGPATPPPVPAE